MKRLAQRPRGPAQVEHHPLAALRVYRDRGGVLYGGDVVQQRRRANHGTIGAQCCREFEREPLHEEQVLRQELRAEPVRGGRAQPLDESENRIGHVVLPGRPKGLQPTLGWAALRMTCYTR